MVATGLRYQESPVVVGVAVIAEARDAVRRDHGGDKAVCVIGECGIHASGIGDIGQKTVHVIKIGCMAVRVADAGDQISVISERGDFAIGIFDRPQVRHTAFDCVYVIDRPPVAIDSLIHVVVGQSGTCPVGETVLVHAAS
jgi:hypothetical protein